MLQLIREKLTGGFAIVILGAIALTLVLTFSNIDTGFSGAGVAAEVNGEDITLRDFRRIYQRQRQQWEANYRAQLPDVLATEMAGQVIQSLVRNRVLAQHVRDQGYRVTNDDVIEVIEANPAFQVGGQFSRPSYKQLLASEGLSVERYEYEQRQSMEMSQFVEGLGYTAFYTPAEFRRYIELDGETRDLRYVLFPVANWKDQVELTDEQISDYYALNQTAFMTEESVSLQYIEIDYSSILATTLVAEVNAQAYYDANPQEFSGPDERQASHILILFGADETQALTQAEELKARLDAGEAFADLAAQYSADTGSAGNGGDLGWLGSGDAPAPEFEDALFGLEKGQISDPVRTEFGYHLIRMGGAQSGAAMTFAEAKADLLVRLAENQAADEFADRVDQMDEQALESLDGLAPVAEALDIELKSVAVFTRSGGLPLGSSRDLISTVFSLEVLEDGENSPVIDLGEGRAVVVSVTEHQPAEIRSLDTVRPEIELQLQAEVAISLAAAAGENVVARLNGDASQEAIKLPAGVEWQVVADVRRGAQELPVDLAAAIFQAPKPANDDKLLYQGILLASGDFAVYTVTASKPGSPALYTQQDRDQRKQQLSSRLGGSQATAMVEELVVKASVNVARDLLANETSQP
jgi:peptidyl-prolyl cis-trans isomerase D